METVEELTISWSDGEDETTRELQKHVLTKGTWATIVYLYQDKDRKTAEWGPKKVSIRRYKKANGVYRMQSKFNISSLKQARELSELLTVWGALPEDE